MCFVLASQMSQFEHTQKRRRRPKPDYRTRHTMLDPVSASRVRLMLERLVIAGLGLPGFAQPNHPYEILPLTLPTRGGPTIALARQVAMYLAHVGCALTLTESGRLYGRDRTTAAHACTVVEDRRDNLVFDRVIELLEQTARLRLFQIEPAIAVRLRRS